ncbi:MAG: glycosyltransferase family 4 protein, partial [Planctomycetes bacterium]|nr:glycosyltransferase family 4 protein [Planctomycetota bacterium]
MQCLQGADPERGIPRWAFGFLSELDRRGVNIVGLENPELQPVHEQFRTPFTTIAPNTRAELRRLSSDHDVVYLCLSPMEPVRPIRSLLPGHVIDAAIPLVSILYDFALYLMPEAYQTRPGDTRTYADRQRVFSKSDLFLCISKSTMRDAETLWSIPSSRLVWAGTGLNDEISKTSVKGADLREFGIEGDFVLVVGRADPRKQTAQAIRAFSQLEPELRSRHQLVIACQISDDIRRKWTTLAASCGLDEGQLV